MTGKAGFAPSDARDLTAEIERTTAECLRLTRVDDIGPCVGEGLRFRYRLEHEKVAVWPLKGALGEHAGMHETVQPVWSSAFRNRFDRRQKTAGMVPVAMRQHHGTDCRQIDIEDFDVA